MWGRIITLVMKELASLWADGKTRFVLLVPPLVQVIIFANAANYDVKHVPLCVWNEDLGVQSAELIRGFAGSEAFHIVGAVWSERQARTAIEDKQAVAVLHVGQDFSADILAGKTAPVQMLLDARRSNTALLASDYAAQIVALYNARLPGATPPPVVVSVSNLFNPALDSKWFILPGLVVILSLMMTVLVGALSLAREKELGTFEQMLVTPLTAPEIMLGKAIPAVIVGLAEANIVLVASLVLFGLPFAGHVWVLELCLVAFSLAGVGIGLAISAVTETQQQAILGVFVYAAPAIMISGYAAPVENMPKLLQWLSYTDPIRYMMVVARGLFLEDLPGRVVWGQVWPMMLIAAVLLGVATTLVRRAIA
ncbi:ABC transporter permease [Acidocella sp.]|uniref:ABC transporter permease n=1 Tax=Acidocella sp. TaxID=50710 RepID=UPI0026148A97|nr:ABC transporter permease [Acidocella sp.]